MKKLFVIAVGFMLNLIAVNAQPAVLIAEYRFDTLMIPPPALTGLYGTSYRTYMNPFVLSSAGNFYQSGLATVNGGYYTNGHPPAAATNRGFIGANWNQTLNTGKYMGFSLTPLVGQILVIDSISQWSAKSNVGPDTTRMRFGPLFLANSWYTVNVGDISWKRSSRTTGLPSSSSTIHVRYYTYHNLLDPNPSGTWRIDDIKIYGHLDGIFNLPVEFLSFTGRARDSEIDLRWSTATEHDNDHFSIEKSYDLASWEEIGQVIGAGNSEMTSDYTLVDRFPRPGLNYYRLSQTDIDGTTVELKTIVVIFGNANTRTRVMDVSGRIIDDWNTQHIFGSGLYLVEDEYGNVRKLYIPP
jgi:hypothetical protein